MGVETDLVALEDPEGNSLWRPEHGSLLSLSSRGKHEQNALLVNCKQNPRHDTKNNQSQNEEKKLKVSIKNKFSSLPA